MSGIKGFFYLFHLVGFQRGNKSLLFLLPLLGLLQAIFLLDLNAAGEEQVPGKPAWTVSLNLTSDTGYGLLEWAQKPGQAVEMFRLSERFEGKTTYSYVSGRALTVFRTAPGKYAFRLSACVRGNEGYPHCGNSSSKLIFTVTEEIYQPYLVEAGHKNTRGSAASTVAPVAGGPDQLRPGLWYNPAKPGQGWSFYWANRLALSSNPENTYDLYGIWYTYEAKTRVITPLCEAPSPPCGFATETYNYRPLVATLQLVQTGSDTFAGGIYITRNGTTVHQGTATITFSGSATSATIDWTANFRHQSLAAQDSVALLLGEDASPFSDPTNFSGLWNPDSGAAYYVIDNIGANAEVVDVVFTDDDGDPVWIQAESYPPMSENETSLCFYYIQGGYAPDQNASIPSSWFVASACDFNVTASNSNRNGGRSFTGWEKGRYWLDFTLPAGAGGNAPAGGSIYIGSSASPAYFTKQASFHRIYSSSGNSCTISATVTTCDAVLTWFTDGDYPAATAFAFNQTTGQRSIIAASTAPVMENQTVPLSVAGSYVFELRMTGSVESRLIAQSALFQVSENQGPAPLAPGNLNVVWVNEGSRRFNVNWSHPDAQSVDYYKLEENRPDGSGTTYTVSPGNSMGRDFAYLPGPFGNHQYRVSACSSTSGPELCSAFTPWVNWQVSDPASAAVIERTWGDNAYGTLKLDYNYNYALGYHFKAAVDGIIKELGGLFNGTRTVRLFQRGGPELARASITSNNSWNYVSIPPVAITAGVEYTVAAYLAGSGASVSTGLNFPQTFAQIEILGSSYANTGIDPNAIPDSMVSTTTMYGQADIGFEAGGSVPEPPIIPPIGTCEDVFVDDFESDRGWVRNQQNADTAVRGLWERSDPNTSSRGSVSYQLGSTPSGSFALSTDGRGGAGHTYDVDGGSTSISSPSIDLPPGGSSYQLKFSYNFAYRSSSASTDRFAVHLVTAAGETLLFEEVDDNSRSHPGSWKSKIIDLSAYAGETVKISFLAEDDAASGALLEAQVDDVGICYVPGTGNTAPRVVQPAHQSNVQGSGIAPMIIQVNDAENDSVSCNISGLPAGLSQSSVCTVSGVISGAVGDYTVNVFANDGQLDSSVVTFTWSVTQASWTANPESPPAPAQPPNRVIDSLSSRVGATAGVFRVDESGSATFTVPILTGPGSGGMAPEISLDYSSQGVNGSLGLGGSLGGLSAISRCGQTLAQDGPGRVQGISLTANDRFCLDGQRLLAVSGAYGADGTTYRTEIDGIAKVVSAGTAGTGPAYFTVWRKDGSVTEYGKTADSRIEARTSGDVQTVLIWAQNRVSDSAGNYIDYEYAERASGAGGPVEFVLDTVRFTGNTRAGTAPYAELDFIYSSNRPDATISVVAGAMIAQSQLLIRVDSRGRVNAGSSLETLRSYFLGYGSDGHGRKVLESITECRDSSQKICFAPTQLSWQNSKHNIGGSGVAIGSIFSGQHVALAMADVSGDGRPDLLLTEKYKKTYRFRIAKALASGGFAPATSVTYTIPHNGNRNQPVNLYTIDLNADSFQDVIYPTSSGWKARLSDGDALGNEVAVSGSCCGMSNPPLVRIMDFDGDGLSDLVTNRATAGTGNELVLLRNGFSATDSSAVGFEAPRLITIGSSANLFPDQSADGWQIVDEQPHFYGQAGNSGKFSQPFDYNGDGTVDLLVRLSQRYYRCTGTCSSPFASASETIGRSQFIFDSEPVTTAPSTSAAGMSYAWVTFYVILVSDGSASFIQSEVFAVGEDCTVFDACNPYADKPVARHVLPVDINADGLADFAYQDALYDWQARINLGGKFFQADIPIASFADDDRSSLSRFQDITGDGYPEFMYPSAIATAGAVWIVHENQFGSAFTAARNSNDKYGDSEGGDASILVDVNGDGMLDNLFIDIDSRGRVHKTNTRVYLGRNNAGGPTRQAMNLLTRISNGFGAQTTINYKPLTDAGVYTRMRDAKNADWGQGYAVHDIIAPIYVVSETQRSAPVFKNAQGVSRIEYHYVGAKVQGGGRGFLGFGEIISYDPQTGIRSNTRYRQDFPFIGRQADSMRVLAGSGNKFTAISKSDTSVPVAWSSVSAGTVAPSWGGGTLLSYSGTQWGSIITVAGQAAIFPYIQKNLMRSYTLGGKLDRKVLTSNSYNSDGDVTHVVVDTYAGDGSKPFTTQTTRNQYLTPDTATWRHGRLSRSTVIHQRGGTPTITRTSSFSYDAATGILEQEVIEPDNNAFKVTTRYQLDTFGNRKSTTVTPFGMASRSSDSNYDPLGRFVIETQNAYQQRVQKIRQWDAFGNALEVENIDGVLTISTADFMGRPFISYTGTGAWGRTIQRYGAGSYCPVGETAFYTLSTGGGQPAKYRCFDVLGRELRTASEGFNGNMIYVDRYYDESGRPERVSEPYFTGDTRYWNRTAYDVLGRVDSVLAANGNDQINNYAEAAGGCIAGGPRQTLISNALGQNRLEVRNVLGETVALFDNHCGEVSYDYDAVGNLTRVIGVDGAVSTTSYDLAGRKISLNDPDKGYWQYAYNALGELTRQFDSKNQAIDFSYDVLGRVTDRRELSAVSSLLDSSYTTVNHEITTWNNSTSASVMGKGQISKVIYRAGENGAIVHQRASSFDRFGRPSIVSTSQDGLQLAEETTYDQYGRVFQQFDASGDGHGIRYHYNNRGYIEKLQEAREGSAGIFYQQIQAMDARGNVTAMVLGNGVEAYASYQAQSGRVEVLEAYDAQGTEIQYVSYRFDAVGNLESRLDSSQARNLSESFSYDGLNRLEQVMLAENGGAAQSTLSLQYDASGNISHKSDVGNYLYGQNGAGPHAVTQAAGVSYRYDANGNQISGGGRTIAYGVFDKATRIEKAGEYTQFIYGIGNLRIERLDNNSIDQLKTTWYFGGTERIQTGSGDAYFKRYLGGIAIADYFPATGRQKMTYLIKDHLGSIHTTVSESGLVADSVGMSFSAFGARRSAGSYISLSSSASVQANSMSTRGFTGHEHVDGLGVIQMNGRIYDPMLGRFLQADPFVQSPKNSQSLNRYTYVYNNPLSYTDPSGYFSLKRFFKKWGRVIVAAVASYFTYGAASTWATGWLAGSTLAGNSVAIGSIAGAASGFVGGAIISGNLGGAVKGAFAGALMGSVAGYFGDTYSLNRIAADSVAGGISSELYGQRFKDGLLFGALISSATYITVRLRAYQMARSKKIPGQIGESKGFRGIEGKLAGERTYEEMWIESGAAKEFADGKPLDWILEHKYLPFKKSLSPLGGFQGGEGLLFGKSYSSGGLVDYVLEGYSGVHDSFNQLYFYTANGTNRVITSFWQKSLGYIVNPANVVLASPFVLPALVPDYMRHFYFQVQEQ